MVDKVKTDTSLPGEFQCAHDIVRDIVICTQMTSKFRNRVTQKDDRDNMKLYMGSAWVCEGRS
jgi:hypothetical protein